MLDHNYDPMTVAQASWLGDLTDSHARMIALGREALAQALEPLLVRAGSSGLRLAIALGLPSPRPGLSTQQLETVAEAITEGAVPTGAGSATVECHRADHAAGLCALHSAMQQPDRDTADAWVVGGVDSFLGAETLSALDAQGQLFCRANARGFVPGEAAAFCLLLTPRGCKRVGLDPLAIVESVSTAVEPVCMGTDDVSVGIGLRRALETALAQLPEPDGKVDDILCDLNGETYRADELAFALVRTSNRFARPGRFRTPAESWGDVGAASAALHMILAASAWDRGYSPGPRILVTSSAGAGPARAAAILHAPS